MANRHLLARYVMPLLFIAFGMSCWISTNAIWIEMPLLATALPEAWNLPSYVAILIQLGNIGPLIMVALKSKLRYSTVIYFIIGWLIASIITLSFVYKTTTPVAGVDRSVAFFILVFFMATCDCTSNVTFWPYMANFNPRYIVFVFIGSGVSGLLASVFGLIQGSGSYECVNINTTNMTNSTSAIPHFFPPKFDFPVFLYAVAGLLALSLSGFTVIETIFRRLRKAAVEELNSPDSTNRQETPVSDIIQVSFTNKREEALSSEALPKAANVQAGELFLSSSQDRPKTPWDFVPEYCLNAVVCFLSFGLMPSIQSYSAVPYGRLVYTIVACLSVAASPLASWLTMCAKPSSFRLLAIIASIAVVPIGYIIALAILCPYVPLQKQIGGYILVIAAWSSYSAIFAYVRVCLTERVQSGGHRALFWFGLSTQGASLIGAIATFLVVAVFHIFNNPIMC